VRDELSIRTVDADGNRRSEAGQSKDGPNDPGGCGETGAGERANMVSGPAVEARTSTYQGKQFSGYPNYPQYKGIDQTKESMLLGWDNHSLLTGHIAMITIPEELAIILLEIVEGEL